MKIATGIKGIRSFMKANRSGWHVFVNGELKAYMPIPVSEVFGIMAEETLPLDLVFIGWTGNVLEFTATLRNC